jgi:hypothetical protein
MRDSGIVKDFLQESYENLDSPGPGARWTREEPTRRRRAGQRVSHYPHDQRHLRIPGIRQCRHN